MVYFEAALTGAFQNLKRLGSELVASELLLDQDSGAMPERWQMVTPLEQSSAAG